MDEQKCQIPHDHCSSCGEADEATEHNDGYSSCCNKRITDAYWCDGDHE